MIRFIPKFLALIILFFAVSGISTYFTVSYFIKHEKTIVVPDLVGKDIVYALEILTNMGLNTKILKSEYNNDFIQNSIIYQDPGSGQIIKQGRDIRIIVSKGTKNLFMPNLKGLNLQQARLILEKNGLVEGNLAKIFHERIKKDEIIAQYPLPGEKTLRGVPANILVSKGTRAAELIMPDLIDYYLDEAVLSVEKSHLAIDSIKTVYRKNKPANIILSQDPPAGYNVKEGQLISLEVNRKAVSSSIGGSQRNIKKTLFRYRLPSGFLKQHIRIEVRAFNTTFVVYDELMTPERELWVAVPAYSVAVLFLYKNDELVLTEIYD